jgi:hypothetical protein
MRNVTNIGMSFKFCGMHYFGCVEPFRGMSEYSCSFLDAILSYIHKGEERNKTIL